MMILTVVWFLSILNVGSTGNTRIVGGKPVTIKDFPYQVSLMQGNSHFCGGAIIGPSLVVTAAHCTDGVNPKLLNIRAGSSIAGIGGQVIKVKQVHQNPKYNQENIDYDVSVLVLSSNISIPNAYPIALASENTPYIPGTWANVTGWGFTSENSTISFQLQMVQIQLLSDTQCKFSYGTKHITNRMFCAGYPSGGKDSCQGDSGGPLVVNNVLYGIVSWGSGCARPGYPGVYTKVAEVRRFIDSNSSNYVNFCVILIYSVLLSFIL